MGPNKWPSTPADFKDLSETYVEKVTSLGNSVMKALAMGLGVDQEIFLSRVDEAFWNLRILGYEGRKSASKENAGIGEHTGMALGGLARKSRRFADTHLSRFRHSYLSFDGLGHKLTAGAG